jgi:hypothetical protein
MPDFLIHHSSLPLFRSDYQTIRLSAYQPISPLTIRLSPYQEYLFTLRSICYAIFVIVKLQHGRRRLFGDSTDLEKDIQLGISAACADLGLLDYLNGQGKQ